MGESSGHSRPVVILVVTAALIAFGVWAVKMFAGAADKVAIAINDFSIFEQKVNTTITNSLGDLNSQGGLLVGWREIDSRIDHEKETEVKIPWTDWGVPVGSVKITLDVTGNRVQYLIPTGGPDGAWSIKAFNDSTVELIVPPPIVNDKVVEVQSDPTKYKISVDNDWLEHVYPSGAEIDAAKGKLREAVIEGAKANLALTEVRLAAKTAARGFCEPMLATTFGRPITVIVQFTDEVAETGSGGVPLKR